MATLAQQSVFARPRVHVPSGLGVQIGLAWESLGLVGRRAAVTAVGAVLALTCGAAVAGAVRLPSDIQGSTQADDMTVQTELPAEAAARAYALENPPTYTVASKADADDAALPSASTDFTIPADETATKTAYTTPSADAEDKVETADHTEAATTTDATPASAPAATADDSGV